LRVVKKLQATIDASSRTADLRQDREHQFFLDKDESLRDLINGNEVATDKKISETRMGVEAKFTMKHDDLERRVESNKRSADDDRKDMDASFSSEIARAIEDRLKNEIDMKKAFQVQNAAQDERNAHVQTELKNHMQYLRADLDTAVQDLKVTTAAADKKVIETVNENVKRVQSVMIEEMETLNMTVNATTDKLATDIVTATNERNNLLMNQKSEFLENLAAAVGNLGDTLDEKTMQLTQKTDQLKAQVEVDVATTIKDLNTKVEKDITEVKHDVATRVQKSIDDVTLKMEVMQTRIKTEVEPSLAEASDNGKRAAAGVVALKDRVTLMEESLTESLQEGLSSLNERIEDMAAGVDIADVLSGLIREAATP